jgi:hypothetical protein
MQYLIIILHSSGFGREYLRSSSIAEKYSFDNPDNPAIRHGDFKMLYAHCDFIAVQVQARQDCAVMDRVEKFVRVPGGCQWTGLRLIVAPTQATIRPGLSKAAPYYFFPV